MGFREEVIKAMGDFPSKPELDFKITGIEERDGYVLQSVEYNVEENERIKAFILIPKALKEKNPAILAIHQHALQYHLGKSEVIGAAGDPMYAFGLELCMRGYVVLAPDHLCFEERIAEPFKGKTNDIRKCEMYEFAKRIHAGSCLRAKYLHDLTIAIDVLENQPYVDKDRIGAVGHSLGGQEATWLMWYDNRIAAGISSCGIGQVDTILRDNNLLSLALYVPGLAKIGDTCDIVCGIAPRPFAMSSGSNDLLFPIDGVETIIGQAKKRYAQFGKPGNFRPIIFEGGHMFGNDEKQEVFTWLDGVLANKETEAQR